MDWFGAVTSLLGGFLNGQDVRISTTIWLTSNIAFIVWGLILGHNYAIGLMNVAHLVINSRTLIIRWRKP